MDKVALPHAEPAAYCTAIFPKREKLSLSLSLSLSAINPTLLSGYQIHENHDENHAATHPSVEQSSSNTGLHLDRSKAGPRHPL